MAWLTTNARIARNARPSYRLLLRRYSADWIGYDLLIDFFYLLKSAGIPVSINEFLHLLDALQRNLIRPTLDDFYFLARVTLIKSEQHFDKFDKVFAKHFQGGQEWHGQKTPLPEKWLRAIERGSWDTDGQLARANVAAATIVPGIEEFGAAGSRIDNGDKLPGAKKTWEHRAYRDHDTGNRISNRNLNIALRKLRKYTRSGMGEDELDLDGTLRDTADSAGMLKIRMRPERKNRFKVLVLLDIGGTMFEHASLTAELFSAARLEFRDMAFFHFHNCIYEHVWKQHWNREDTFVSTWDIIRRYAPDTRLIFVGDAKMGPAEINEINGSLLHRNDEPGKVWLQRLIDAYPKFIWLNPEPLESWDYRESIAAIRDIMQQRMFPLTIDGLERGMQLLSK